MNNKIRTIDSIARTEKLIITIKNVILCFLVVSLLFTFIGSFMNPTNAAVTSNGKDGKEAVYTVNGTQYKVADLHNKTFGGLVLKLAFWLYGDQLTNIVSSPFLLEIDTSTDQTTDYWVPIDTIYNAMTAVGTGLALLWCLLELMDKATMGNVTGEFALKLSIKFTIAAIFISESGPLAKGIIELANAITADVGNASANGVSDALFVNIYNNMKDGNIFDCLGELIGLIFPAIFMLIAYIVIYVLLAGRIIEVGVRFAFFPIGAAGVFTHGIASPGFRYMKKLFACALTGAGMIAVLMVGVTLMSMEDKVIGANNYLLSAFFPLIVGFSMVGAMMKVQSIMNDVAGV